MTHFRCNIYFIAEYLYYTASQLYEITLLVPPFCLAVGWNLCQYQYNVPENISKTSRDPLTNFYGRSKLLFCPGQPSISVCWFPQLSQRQCGAFPLITFSRHGVQVTLSNQSDNYANQYPVCNYWKYFSVLMSWAFSEGDVKNYWSVTRCHLNISTSCWWEQQSYPGTTRASIEDDRIKRRPRPFCIPGRKRFLLAYRIRVALIRRTGRPVFVPHNSTFCNCREECDFSRSLIYGLSLFGLINEVPCVV